MSEFFVSIYYKGGPDIEKDYAIDSLAQECGGYEVGAGTVISTGERDVQLIFEDESDAARFQQRAEKQFDWASNISDMYEF